MNQNVTVREFGGRVVEKVLVEDLGDVILVTTPEEWKSSQIEQRKPVTVGFKREYIVKIPPTR
jgi:hypothetical protein